jgi:hypothetical protein
MHGVHAMVLRRRAMQPIYDCEEPRVNTFVTIVGWMCLLLLSAAFAGLAVVIAATACRKALERFEWAIDAKTRHEVGRSIGASSHWFSENPDTSLALRILAERLMNEGGADADQWREQWRKGRVRRPEAVNG